MGISIDVSFDFLFSKACAKFIAEIWKFPPIIGTVDGKLVERVQDLCKTK